VRDDLPTGTVTFLFTDVEGSTKLLHSLGAETYAEALAEHRRVIREACAAEGGVEVDTQGDAFFFAFPTAPGSLAAAAALTEALAPGPIHVRVGLHTGTPLVTDEGYVGDDVHRAARIAAVGHGGQVLVAAPTAALVGLDGLADLGEHRFKDLVAPERVYQLGEQAFPPLKSLYRSNLPIAANPLVGRKKELADVLQALLDGSRAVTITGPGGVGKTRFALAVASEAAEAFPDGVWFVPLAALRDPALVLPTVAEAIGADGDVARYIGDGACLLFLDNLEQVVEAAPGLGELAGECPRLRLLVTSREAMRITVEREYPLSPLPESPSVELFRQRVDAVAPELEVEYETAVEICDRLDRLPLAIELAAARCKALSPEQILERLSESLDLLRGGRDADPRQQTLRTTIQWSYGLLSVEEQRVFRALSVFRGGCTLEAAETVCDADLDTLQSLVEKSLLRFTRERYWMLETIREFSRERVIEVGEADAYRHRHARYFLDRLGEAYGERLGPRRPEVIEWYGAEVDNLRAMLDSLVAEAPAEAARATHQLFKFWRSLPVHSEAVERLETLLALKLADDLRAETLACLAEVRDYFGNLDAAWAAADEALKLAMPGTPARGLSLLIVASREVLRGNVDEGIRLAEQAATEARELEGPEIANATQGDVAMLLLSAGRREESRALMMDVIAEARTNRFFDERHMVGRLGFIDVLEADYESARRVLAYAVGQTRSVGNPWETWALQWLGYAYLGLGDRGSARATFGELLEISADAGKTVRPELAVALGGLARSVEQMDLREGARLAGAVAQLRDDAGGLKTWMWPQEREIEVRFQQPLIDALGEVEYRSAHEEGRMLSFDETLSLVRSLAAS
jgi:predicted ATPase